MTAFFKSLWLVLFLLVAFSASSCMTSNACPYGWVQNATGDCVKITDLDGDDGNGQVIDPCPEGWALGEDGFCHQITDGDTQVDGDIDSTDGVDADAETGDQDDAQVDGDSSPAYRSCTTDTDCYQAELCQFMDNEGNGICYNKCILTGNCIGIESNSYCSQEQRCVLGAAPEYCDLESTCEYGNVCHNSANCGKGKCFPQCKQDSHCSSLYEGLVCESGDDDAESDSESIYITDYYCSGENKCEPGIVHVDSCQYDSECPVDEVCHYELNNGNGKCLESCQYTAFCENFVEDFICNTEGKCIADNSEYCSADRDCPYGQVCHQDISLCNVKCVSDSLCTPYSSGLWCNSLGYCAQTPTVDGCQDDTACHYGNVCHDEVPNTVNPDRGTCMPYCTDAQDCMDRIGGTSGWYCNALNECSPDSSSDGDVDIDNSVADPCDTDVVCEAQHRRCFNNNGVAECGSCLNGYYENQGECEQDQTCTQITTNSVLTINVETAKFRAIAKKNGAIYSDPTGKSAIYLKDNTSGSIFKVYGNFSDGGSLEPVEVIKGSYNIYVQNALGQRKEVLKNIEIDNDVEIDVPFDFLEITVYLKKNGNAFPQLSAQYRGELILYDESARSSHVLGTIGDGSNAFTIDVFASTYSIIFSGYLSENPNANQYATIISKDPVSDDRNYNLNLETVTISGSIDLNGSVDGGEDEDFGQVWLINVTTNERFRFWPISTLSAINYSREVIKDFYYVCYKPKDIDAHSYLWRESNFRQWDSSSSSEDITFNLVHFTGEILYNTSDFFELYDEDTEEYLDRGDLYLRDSSTNEMFHWVDLGSEGNVYFDKWIGPGTYDFYYKGKLIEDSYYKNNVHPSAEQSIFWQTDVDITANKNMNINLPVVVLNGTVSMDFGGQTPDFSTATNDIITLRRSGTSSDIPIFRFVKLDGNSYSGLVFPGTYSVRFQGSTLLGVYQSNIVRDGLLIPSQNSFYNINISTNTLTVKITAGSNTLYDLLQNKTYDMADIRVANEITRLMASNEVDEDGKFTIERPLGDISILLYLYKGNDMQIYPLLSKADWDFDSDKMLTIDISPVTFAVNVLKNGEALSNATLAYSRGEIFMGSDEHWETDIRFDLGREGEAYSIQSVQEGVYDYNLSVGYGGAFEIIQWKYLGCVNISK